MKKASFLKIAQNALFLLRLCAPNFKKKALFHHSPIGSSAPYRRADRGEMSLGGGGLKQQRAGLSASDALGLNVLFPFMIP